MPHYAYITHGLHPCTLCAKVVEFTVCVCSFCFLLLSDYLLQSIMAHAPRNSMVGGIGRLGRAAVYKKRALYKRTKVRALAAICVSGLCIYGIPLGERERGVCAPLGSIPCGFELCIAYVDECRG